MSIIVIIEWKIAALLSSKSQIAWIMIRSYIQLSLIWDQTYWNSIFWSKEIIQNGTLPTTYNTLFTRDPQTATYTNS